MNIQEIKEFIETNKSDLEVQQLISSFKDEPTLELFKEKISTDAEFKSFMDSEKDKHHSKALDTWKTNNLDIIVDEKISKLYPKDDPKDLAIRKMEEKLEKMERDANKERMRNLALKEFSSKGINNELVDYFIGADETTTLENIDKFSRVYEEDIQATIKEKLKGNGDVIPKDKNIGGVNPFSADTLNLTEQGRIIRENPELAKELKKQAGI